MAKSKQQIAISILGLISYGIGAKTILQTQTMILTPLVLVLLFTPFVLGISIGLGFATKTILKSKWHWLTFTSIFVSAICLIFFFKGHRNYDKLKVRLDEHKEGYYFIISTVDKDKAAKFDGSPITFDNNNVIYLDSGLYNNCTIIPVNKNDDDISKRLKNFMRNEFASNFYNPNDEEYELHPNWSEYYLGKHGTSEKSKLEEIGYIFYDPALTKSN